MRSEQAIITVLCMIYHDDEILLQNRIAQNWPGVTFPGGHVEKGESFVEAIIREMKEETGLEVRDLRLCGLKQLQSEDEERYVILLFKTESFSGELVSSKEGKMQWVKRSELDRYPLAPDFKELLEVFDRDDIQELMLEQNADGDISITLH